MELVVHKVYFHRVVEDVYQYLAHIATYHRLCVYPILVYQCRNQISVPLVPVPVYQELL